MGYNESEEIKEFESEKKALEIKNEVYRNNFSEQLLNGGVGENMIKIITSKPKKQNKIKIFINRILEVL